MKVSNLRPILCVDSIDDTVRFYRDVLGFMCIRQLQVWAALRRDDVEIMISLPNAHEPFEKPSFTGSLYFNCDDADAWWRQLKDRAPIVYPIENFHYGMREFAIRDNNGYCLQFGSRITNPSDIPQEET